MNKIKIIKKKKEKYVYTKLLQTQSLNQREIELLGSRQVMELIVPQLDMGKTPAVMYKISALMTLKEHLRSVTSKDNFLKIVLSIMGMMKTAQEKMLYTANFLWDSEYIFVDPLTKGLRYVYLPIANYDPEYNVKTMFLSLAYDTVFNQLENCSYVTEYISYFNTHPNFSIYDFELFVRELNGEIIAAGEQEINTAHPSKLLQKEAKLCMRCGATFMSNDNFCDKCGERLVFVSAQKTQVAQPQMLHPQAIQQSIPVAKAVQPQLQIESQPQPQAQPASMGTTVLGVVECGTTVLSPYELGQVVYPYIIRKNTGERINVNCAEFSIGQGNTVDYMVTGNTAVSRKHANIITKGDKYYIVDLGSTNGTYIDDVKIIANQETEIVCGQKLRFANEEYEFMV